MPSPRTLGHLGQLQPPLRPQGGRYSETCRVILVVLCPKENSGGGGGDRRGNNDDAESSQTTLVDTTDGSGSTLLHKACVNGYSPSKRLLLSRDVRHLDNGSKNTPLHWAAGVTQTYRVCGTAVGPLRHDVPVK